MAAKPGDAEFEAFVRASWRRLSQAAFALTGDAHEAEDLLQSVLERTYARWSSVARPGRGDPVAYVKQALVHRYVDGWRRRQRVRLDPTDTPPDTAVTGGMDGATDRAELRQLLGPLTERERGMVVMRYYLDCSEQEVASTFGCTVGTVKSTCSRALQRLRVPTSLLERETS